MPAVSPAGHSTMPPDHGLSPFTGYTRQHWRACAEQLVSSALRYASPHGSLVVPPGRASKYGRRSDGLEGFARTFLIAACRVAGQAGDDPAGLLEPYARGLAAGTDPRSTERWPGTNEVQQANVEAGGLARRDGLGDAVAIIWPDRSRTDLALPPATHAAEPR